MNDLWLSVFGWVCGQNPDHSWAPGGVPLPFCQRCTGLYLGALAAAVAQGFFRPRLGARFLELHGLALLLMAPFGFHWLPQGPALRASTGVLFGCGVVTFLRAGLGACRTRPARSEADAVGSYLLVVAVTLAAVPMLSAHGGAWAGGALTAGAAGGLLALAALAVAALMQWVKVKPVGGGAVCPAGSIGAEHRIRPGGPWPAQRPAPGTPEPTVPEGSTGGPSGSPADANCARWTTPPGLAHRELFLFVRPPRPLWPFNGPDSAFWPPLAFASLAASLREKVRGVDVAILDAPALEMGWRSLAGELRRRRPTWVGIGEEAVSCVEGLRLARLARDGGARVVAGGCFFGQAAVEALETGLIDAVVHGEGERTLVELVEAWRGGGRPDLAPVAGLSFRDGAAAVRTPARPLIRDLDDLPWPAYDLLPVARYGARSRNHPRLAAIELGRGCTGSCDFCVLWRQMGRASGNATTPHYRAKSPERLLEEIRHLVRVHRRAYLGWVDPCFNADPVRPAALAELLLRDGITLGQSAWVRADGIVRDTAAGTFSACVQAGLNEVYIGIERPDDVGLAGLGKRSRAGDAREALRLVRTRFPKVLTVGSFIYGLPGDTPAQMRAIHDFALELELDQFFCIPLTPLPGTAGWRRELWDPTGERFRRFSFLPSQDPAGPYAPLERALRRSALFHWPRRRLRLTARRLVGTDARRRRVGWRLFIRGARFQASAMVARALGRPRHGGLSFPAWYDR